MSRKARTTAIWAIPAIVVWLAAVGWPAVAILFELRTTSAPNLVDWSVLGTSVLWAGAVAAGSAVVGWLPGIYLGSELHRRRAVLPILVLAPLCLPAYVIFTCWWQAVPPNSWLQSVAAQAGWTALLRRIILAVGLLCWSWPIVTWCVASSRTGADASVQEMMRLDGARRVDRLVAALRLDRAALLLGAGIVFLFTLNNTCFDLAQVRTFGYEVRTLDSQGASAGDTLLAAWPGGALALAIATWVWLTPRVSTSIPRAHPQPPRGGRALTYALLAMSTLIPVILLVGESGHSFRLSEFILLYGDAIVNTLCAATMIGLTIAVITVSLAMAWHTRRRLFQLGLTVISLGFLVGICVPGTIPAVAIEAAWNRPVLGPVMYDSPVGLVLGGCAVTGFLAAWFARAVGRSEPNQYAAMRRIDGATAGLSLFVASRPRIVGAAVAAGAIAFSLSLGEVVASARLQRPGFDVVATSILNAIHYQQPETIILSLAIMVIVGVVAAGIAIVSWRPLQRVALIVVVSMFVGCERDPSQTARIPTERIFGSVGVAPGQFNYPRGIDVDPRTKKIYVVDKTARIQRFSFEGRCEASWRMPDFELGKPTGISVGPDGNVYVPDTHYHRVMVFDPEGHELLRFGEYGLGPRQFVYPTDIAFDGDGNLYVTEYGGNDRIQVFTPKGEWIRTFGSCGDAPGQFSRPQSVGFSPDGAELYVMDACNHRIQVFTREGAFVRTFGHVGRGPGEVSYPYGLAVLEDGDLLIAEFGNNRVQRMGPDGASKGVWGGIGFDEGRVRYPWGVAATGGTIFVLDSGNNRVQVTDGI